MTGILMTQVSTPIIGQAAWVLGKIMNGIYRVMDLVGIHNLGICIILLTISCRLQSNSRNFPKCPLQ